MNFIYFKATLSEIANLLKVKDHIISHSNRNIVQNLKIEKLLKSMVNG
jgi:hypothetical protein